MFKRWQYVVQLGIVRTEAQVVGIACICGIVFLREAGNAIIHMLAYEIGKQRTCRSALWQRSIQRADLDYLVGNVLRDSFAHQDSFYHRAFRCAEEVLEIGFQYDTLVRVHGGIGGCRAASDKAVGVFPRRYSPCEEPAQYALLPELQFWDWFMYDTKCPVGLWNSVNNIAADVHDRGSFRGCLFRVRKQVEVLKSKAKSASSILYRNFGGNLSWGSEAAGQCENQTPARHRLRNQSLFWTDWTELSHIAFIWKIPI